MASASRAITALLTEHFRYTPLTLIDDIINAVNTIIYRGVEAIETGLLNIPPNTLGFPSKQEQDGENTAAADEIEHGVHQLETLLGATADKAFDKFEIYTLRNILTVPEDVAPWVRLSHYEVLRPSLLLELGSKASLLCLSTSTFCNLTSISYLNRISNSLPRHQTPNLPPHRPQKPSSSSAGNSPKPAN